MPNLARIFVCLWSGLPLAVGASDFSPLQSYLAEAVDDGVRAYAEKFPLNAPPGNLYAYSGIGTDVAARAAAVASGSSRNELLLETVCRPLGISHTYCGNTAGRSEQVTMPERYFRDRQSGKLRLSTKRRQVPADEYTA